jgi:hypothetical protein
MVAILKQPQYQPLPVEQQVIRDTRALSDDLHEALTRAVQAAKSLFTEKPGADEHHDAHAEDGGEG